MLVNYSTTTSVVWDYNQKDASYQYGEIEDRQTAKIDHTTTTISDLTEIAHFEASEILDFLDKQPANEKHAVLLDGGDPFYEMAFIAVWRDMKAKTPLLRVVRKKDGYFKQYEAI